MSNKKIRLFLEITLGVFLLDFAFYFFFTPVGLVTGGVMGLSIIINNIVPISFSIFLYIVDVFCLILGLLFLGKDFFLKSVYASVLSPTIVLLFEKISPNASIMLDQVVESKLIIACICGSLLSAFGLGLCFRNNGSTGGMDIIQKIISKYFHLPLSTCMHFTDWVIVFLGGFVFGTTLQFNIENVVYGIIAVLLIGYLVDSIAIYGKSRRTAYIITNHPNEVKNMIFTKIGRGVTECDVRGGFTEQNKVMLICTLDKNESYLLRDYVLTADKDAFTFISQTKEVLGEYETIKRKKRNAKINSISSGEKK